MLGALLLLLLLVLVAPLPLLLLMWRHLVPGVAAVAASLVEAWISMVVVAALVVRLLVLLPAAGGAFGACGRR